MASVVAVAGSRWRWRRPTGDDSGWLLGNDIGWQSMSPSAAVHGRIGRWSLDGPALAPAPAPDSLSGIITPSAGDCGLMDLSAATSRWIIHIGRDDGASCGPRMAAPAPAPAPPCHCLTPCRSRYPSPV